MEFLFVCASVVEISQASLRKGFEVLKGLVVASNPPLEKGEFDGVFFGKGGNFSLMPFGKGENLLGCFIFHLN
jgi:hypothetical protein